MNKGMAPLLALELANSKKPRRPSGSRCAYLLDPLKNQETLIDFLEHLQHPSIDYLALASLTINLDEIENIREAVDQILIYILEKQEFLMDAIIILNESAKNCCWVRQLRTDGTYADVMQTGTLAGMIASICVMELAQCDITRIKVCSQAPCTLYFYDTTRNRSARWHAENPCGWRARSERRK